jgi:hypothetical protein
MRFIGREACRRDDAVFSRRSSCVGVSFIVLRDFFESASRDLMDFSVVWLLA